MSPMNPRLLRPLARRQAPAATDPYFSSVDLLLHFDGNLADSSSNSRVVTASGGAATSSGEKKFGSGSLLLDGVDDYLTAAGTSLNAGNGDWTIEAWVWMNSLTATFPIVVGNPRSFYYEYVYQGEQWLLIVGDGIVNPIVATRTGLTPAAQTWWHVALVKEGGTITAFENGAPVASTTDSLANVELDDLYIGAEPVLSLFGNGYIDELRVTKAVRYPGGAAFTPPDAAFPNG